MGWGEEDFRGFGTVVDTLPLYLNGQPTNKDLLYSTGNSDQCYSVAAWMGGEFGGD